MRLVIAGSRTIKMTTDELAQIMDRYQLFHKVTEIISGGAQGVDLTAQKLAAEEGIEFRLEVAPWAKYGKAAGPMRNRKMALLGDALLLIWDGKSRGSANMKKQMEDLDKPIYEVVL